MFLLLFQFLIIGSLLLSGCVPLRPAEEPSEPSAPSASQLPLLIKGRDAIRAGEVQTGIQLLQTFLESAASPSSQARAHFYLAEAYQQEEDWYSAYWQLNAVSRLAPEYAERRGVGNRLRSLARTHSLFHRMVGAQVFQLRGVNAAEIEDEIREMRERGIDTIILRVFQNPGDRFHSFQPRSEQPGVYFRSSQAPLVSDLLDLVTDIAHRNELRVYAWMTTRTFPWKLRTHPDWLDHIYNIEEQRIIRGHRLDPFHPEAREFLVELFRDLARYPIDGLLLQDDLVLRWNVGFGPHADSHYTDATGRELNPQALYFLNQEGAVRYHQEFWSWSHFKSNYLLRLLQTIREAVRQMNPTIRLALNIYYDSVLSPQNGVAWLAQDIRRALAYDIDYFAVMTYHRQIAKELELSESDTLQRLTDIKNRMLRWVEPPERIALKLQMKDWKSGEWISDQERDRILATFGKETSLIFSPYPSEAFVPISRSSGISGLWDDALDLELEGLVIPDDLKNISPLPLFQGISKVSRMM